MNENERESIERTDINEEITTEENGDGNGNRNGNREVLAENPMGYKPVRGLLLKMSAPLMISMFVQSLYNIVDAFSVRPDMAHKVTGKCVISAANAVFIFQEIQLFLCGVG